MPIDKFPKASLTKKELGRINPKLLGELAERSNALDL